MLLSIVFIIEEESSQGITANLVQPGSIDTDMNPVEGPFGPTLKTPTATGDHGNGEDMAQAVVFLVSAKAGYITGAALTVDGGANA